MAHCFSSSAPVRLVRAIIAQGPCESCLYRSNLSICVDEAVQLQISWLKSLIEFPWLITSNL